MALEHTALEHTAPEHKDSEAAPTTDRLMENEIKLLILQIILKMALAEEDIVTSLFSCETVFSFEEEGEDRITLSNLTAPVADPKIKTVVRAALMHCDSEKKLLSEYRTADATIKFGPNNIKRVLVYWLDHPHLNLSEAIILRSLILDAGAKFIDHETTKASLHKDQSDGDDLPDTSFTRISNKIITDFPADVFASFFSQHHTSERTFFISPEKITISPLFKNYIESEIGRLTALIKKEKEKAKKEKAKKEYLNKLNKTIQRTLAAAAENVVLPETEKLKQAVGMAIKEAADAKEAMTALDGLIKNLSEEKQEENVYEKLESIFEKAVYAKSKARCASLGARTAKESRQELIEALQVIKNLAEEVAGNAKINEDMMQLTKTFTREAEVNEEIIKLAQTFRTEELYSELLKNAEEAEESVVVVAQEGKFISNSVEIMMSAIRNMRSNLKRVQDLHKQLKEEEKKLETPINKEEHIKIVEKVESAQTEIDLLLNHSVGERSTMAEKLKNLIENMKAVLSAEIEKKLVLIGEKEINMVKKINDEVTVAVREVMLFAATLIKKIKIHMELEKAKDLTESLKKNPLKKQKDIEDALETMERLKITLSQELGKIAISLEKDVEKESLSKEKQCLSGAILLVDTNISALEEMAKQLTEPVKKEGSTSKGSTSFFYNPKRLKKSPAPNREPSPNREPFGARP